MEINYIYEINRFHRYLSTHNLSTSSQLLWFKLMDLFNSQKWSEEWISLSNQRLMFILQTTSEKTAIRARNGLIDANLIYYTPGTKSSPGKYKMNYFCSMDSRESEDNGDIGRRKENTVKNTVEEIQCKNYSVNNTDNQEKPVINTVKSTDNQKCPVANTVKSTDNIKKKKENIDINIYNTSTSSLYKNNNNNHEKENRPKYFNNREEKKIMDVINGLDKPKEFKIALIQFVIFRGKAGSPISTEYCLKLILHDLERLAPYDDDMQIKILNQSIANGWKKLVEVPETADEISSVARMQIDIYKEMQEKSKENISNLLKEMAEEEEETNNV